MARRSRIISLHTVTPQAAYNAGVYDAHGGHQLLYRLLIPGKYAHVKRYPLVVILHGAGERGTDNTAQLRNIAPAFLRDDVRRNYPCYVLVPQCPPKAYWVNARYIGHRFVPDSTPTWRIQAVLQLIGILQTQYPIDPTRIYLIGYSMGGSGTWDLLVKHPRMFAAAVPICGRGDTSQAKRIVDVPVWVFHGAQDRTVGVSWSRDMVAALRRAGGHPKYTEYPDAAHNSWNKAMTEPELLPWLFQQRQTAKRLETVREVFVRSDLIFLCLAALAFLPCISRYTLGMPPCQAQKSRRHPWTNPFRTVSKSCFTWNGHDTPADVDME